MCPPGLGYHHNGFMATPELGHRMYGYTLWGRITLWSQTQNNVVFKAILAQTYNCVLILPQYTIITLTFGNSDICTVNIYTFAAQFNVQFSMFVPAIGSTKVSVEFHIFAKYE